MAVHRLGLGVFIVGAWGSVPGQGNKIFKPCISVKKKPTVQVVGHPLTPAMLSRTIFHAFGL